MWFVLTHLKTHLHTSTHSHIKIYDRTAYTTNTHYDAVWCAAEQNTACAAVCTSVCVPKHLLLQLGLRHTAVCTRWGFSRYNCCTHSGTHTGGNSSWLSHHPLCERQAHFPTQWLASRIREPAHHRACGECFHRHTLTDTHTHTRTSLSNQLQLEFLFFLFQQETGLSGETAAVSHTFVEKQGQQNVSQKILFVSGGDKKKVKGINVCHNQTGSHWQTQRSPTVSVAVVGMCDTPETLLSSSVPDLQKGGTSTSSPSGSIIFSQHVLMRWHINSKATFKSTACVTSCIFSCLLVILCH